MPNNRISKTNNNVAVISSAPHNKSVALQPPKSPSNYICNICTKAFSYSNDLRKHLRIHSDERPFSCNQCGLKFRQAGCLKNHIACQHGSSVTFICHYCNKAFPIKERLRLHMRIHSGEKPYKCQYCNKRFSRGGQISQHLATHNACKAKHLCRNLDSNKNFNICKFCGKSFAFEQLYKRHQQVCQLRLDADKIKPTTAKSSTFKCLTCNSTFLQQSQLKVHCRIHSGERPYACQVCWRSFAHSSVLKLHIRKHTGEKPFRCTICSDTWFSQLPHLKTHMRTIHGMDKTYQCNICHDFFKTKNEHNLHSVQCTPTSISNNNSNVLPKPKPKISESDGASLSQMRFHIAVLLKRISTPERLKQLGFEKILIDNVIVGALKKASRPFEAEQSLSEIERFRRNIRYFLEWTVPSNVLSDFVRNHATTSVEQILVTLTQKLSSQ